MKEQNNTKWEYFLDSAYFDNWAVKFKDCGNFNRTIHVTSKDEAIFLCEELNRIGAILE